MPLSTSRPTTPSRPSKYKGLVEFGIVGERDIESKTRAIVLRYPESTRVAGEKIKGFVDINYAQAEMEDIERVGVKLKGRSLSTLSKNPGNPIIHSDCHQQDIALVRQHLLLWSNPRDTRFPSSVPQPPSSSRPSSSRPSTSGGTPQSLISIPFSFDLPTPLPPSFYVSRGDGRGMIDYCIEVVGERHQGSRHGGHLRVRKVFKVIPDASDEIIRIRRQLFRGGWTGSWRSYIREGTIKQRGLRGEGDSKLVLRLPDIARFPTSTPIPFFLMVTTSAKTSRTLRHHSFKETETIDTQNSAVLSSSSSSSPPALAAGLNARIDRLIELRCMSAKASKFTRTIEEPIADLPVTEQDSKKERSRKFHKRSQIDKIEVETLPPEWVQEDGDVIDDTQSVKSSKSKKDKGKKVSGYWKKQVNFKGTLTLREMPSFKTENIVCRHSLHLEVPLFPASGNAPLVADIPLELASGFKPLPPPTSSRAPRISLMFDKDDDSSLVSQEWQELYEMGMGTEYLSIGEGSDRQSSHSRSSSSLHHSLSSSSLAHSGSHHPSQSSSSLGHSRSSSSVEQSQSSSSVHQLETLHSHKRYLSDFSIEEVEEETLKDQLDHPKSSNVVQIGSHDLRIKTDLPGLQSAEQLSAPDEGTGTGSEFKVNLKQTPPPLKTQASAPEIGKSRSFFSRSPKEKSKPKHKQQSSQSGGSRGRTPHDGHVGLPNAWVHKKATAKDDYFTAARTLGSDWL